MAIPRGLIEAVLKYRKRRQRPIGATIPGYAGQCDFARPRTRVPGDNYVISPGSVVTPEVYMDDLPNEYIPEAGFMDIPEPDYGSYETPFVQAPFTPAPIGIAPLPRDFEVVGVEYDDCLMNQELFEHVMRLASMMKPVSLDQIVELNANHNLIERLVGIEELSDRLMPTSELAPDMFLPSPAIDASDGYTLPPIEPLPDQMNYSAIDPHDFFDQQIQMMESQFNQFDPIVQMGAVFDVHEALFELSQHAVPFGPAMPEPSMGVMGPMPGPASLDDIIEAHDLGVPSPGYGPDMPAYGGSSMTQELFDQQMHEAAEQMTPEGIGPDPYGYGMIPGGMYEPMPPDMMEPEMMDPYMMPGPMGPNFMPDPPPGP
jgi:hypothetical protein